MRRLLAPALVVATLWVFAPVRHHGFLDYDDRTYVTERPEVRAGLGASGVAWAFTNVAAGNWHPVTWLSHMLDEDLFGLDPGPQHLVNVALHALSAVLLFSGLARATGAPGRAAFAAAVFALHPQRVESVAWIAERKDVLSGVFFFAALCAYGRWTAAPSAARGAALLALALLGLLSKSMLMTLPIVLLLVDLWPLGRLRTTADLPARLREKAPLIALCGAIGAIALFAQWRGGSLTTLEVLPPQDRVANALVSPVLYLRDFLWPTQLAVLYPHPRGGWGWWQPLGAAALLCAITLACLRAVRTRPVFLAGWLWFLVMLLPVIGLVQVGAQARADRYTYLPMVGPVVAMTWGIADANAFRRIATALPVAALAALLALAAATRAQLAWWRDDATLFARAAAVTRDNAIAYSNWANALDADPVEQRALLERALAIEPRLASAHYGLGRALERDGDPEGAEREYRLALRSDPNHASAHNNLGNLLLASGRIDEAILHYRVALAREPGRASTSHNLAVALREQAEAMAREPRGAAPPSEAPEPRQ
ncbi:MAG TPA: tetratricopeptide repeat protein [Myxococcota bacterium]|nr:tetratricopeptide repeat protein [Myxococcota bacterium]